MMADEWIETVREAPEGVGGEARIEAMDEDSRYEIGRKTFRFVKECMRDPVLRAKIKALAAEIRAEEERAAAVMG